MNLCFIPFEYIYTRERLELAFWIPMKTFDSPSESNSNKIHTTTFSPTYYRITLSICRTPFMNCAETNHPHNNILSHLLSNNTLDLSNAFHELRRNEPSTKRKNQKRQSRTSFTQPRP